MKVNLLPADIYIVKNCTIINDEVRNVLIKLYQPIIGSLCINLYLTLWSDLDSQKIMSVEYTHHSLMAKTRLKLEDILESREKLEAIGLLKTFVKKENVNSYIYELYSPLEPKQFFDNPILSSALESNVGKKEFKRILKFFVIPKIDLKDYEDISSSFSSVFDVTTSNFTYDGIEIRKVNNVDIVTSINIDLNKVFASIPDDYLNKKSINKDINSFISKLAFIYNLNEDELEVLIRNSIDDKHLIDKKLLRENCQNYYSFENFGKSPSLIYKKQPDYLRTITSDGSKKSKLIYTFETTSPYDYLSGKNKGVKPSKSDLMLLETLLIDFNLNPGVVNVLIDYVLKINDNKLTKNFVTTIASQWKRSNIKTVLEAMEICKRENKKKRGTKKNIKKEIKPSWYDKNIEEDKASEEEIAKLEAMMNR